MSSLISASAFDALPFCYKDFLCGLAVFPDVSTIIAGSELCRIQELELLFLLVGFDWDVVADWRCSMSKPGRNVGFLPVYWSGGESLLHSGEVEVPCVVEELVRFVPFFAPLPAGVFYADFG